MDFKDFNKKEVKIGEVIVADFLIKSVELKEAKNGKKYLDLELMNKDNTVLTKKWDATEEMLDEIKNMYAIRVKAKTNEWQGDIQLVIEQYKEIKDGEMDINNFLPASPIDFAVMDLEITNTIESMSNETIKSVTMEIYKNNRESLRYHGGAKVQHHNYVSGLLYHEYTMLMMAKGMVNTVYDFKNINKDYLYAGIILHDLGKIQELKANKYGIVEDYTMVGELVGHLVIASENIVEAALKLGLDKNCEELVILRHMMISHHGELEYGSNRNPMTREADLLYRLDNMNCHDTMINDIKKDMNPGEFSKRQWALDNRKIYKTKGE